MPFIVGGDHSLEYPNIAGLADVHGKGSFGVVHFDSHFDAGKDQPHSITHGAPVYRAVKEGHVQRRTSSRWGCATLARAGGIRMDAQQRHALSHDGGGREACGTPS